MAGYGIAQKKSERDPVQHKPQRPLCGACGKEVNQGKLLCIACLQGFAETNVDADTLALTR